MNLGFDIYRFNPPASNIDGVPDTSIIIKWFVEEEGSDQALLLAVKPEAIVQILNLPKTTIIKFHASNKKIGAIYTADSIGSAFEGFLFSLLLAKNISLKDIKLTGFKH